ncbi:hypothetical protein FRB94_013852 [Tulasnella sp. JGI-2019a]|nr:hypothetical protein FRB94_013852 [Tulasnella sp. JGI-2019a]
MLRHITRSHRRPLTLPSSAIGKGQHRMFALHPPPRSQQLPTFHHQRSLPRLPVPPLRATLGRYLKSLEPILEQNEEKGQEKAASALQKRAALAKEFEEGLGKVLHERLVDLDHASPDNWLNDTLWLKKAYHEWRAPLLIYSNWWLLFHDDPTIPEPLRQQGLTEGELSDWQIRRAAWLISRLVIFKEKIDRQEIHPDSSRTGLWFRRWALSLFNIARIPLPGCDALSQPPSSSTVDTRSITVMCKDWLYTVEVQDRDQNCVNVNELEKRLWEVVEDVRAREKRGEKAVAVGILTADERDLWAKNRERLMTLSPINRATMAAIETSLLTLSLDDYMLPPRPPVDPAHSSLVRPEIDAHVSNCASGGPTGLNRWYDKALTVMVESSGRAGMLGEHSPCDALIPSMIVDYAIAEHIDTAAFESTPLAETVEVEEKQKWRRLDWALDEAIMAEVEAAKLRARQLVADSDPSQLWFGEYGVDWMKSVAKLPPDAYIQMALQLAWYKDQGYMTATYETASTRLFKHGRTEVIRTLSGPSRAFVRAMSDPSTSAETRRNLLTAATTAHNAFTRDASTGKGCDRHLQGLKWLLREGESSPFFEDELFAKSAEWKLSTSGLSAGTRFHGTGFGTVWPDGYGINYLAGPKLIKFGIESKVSCETTSTQTFKSKVVESLREMRALFEEDGVMPMAKL